MSSHLVERKADICRNAQGQGANITALLCPSAWGAFSNHRRLSSSDVALSLAASSCFLFCRGVLTLLRSMLSLMLGPGRSALPSQLGVSPTAHSLLSWPAPHAGPPLSWLLSHRLSMFLLTSCTHAVFKATSSSVTRRSAFPTVKSSQPPFQSASRHRTRVPHTPGPACRRGCPPRSRLET